MPSQDLDILVGLLLLVDTQMNYRKLESNEAIFAAFEPHLNFLAVSVINDELNFICDLPRLRLGTMPVYIFRFEDENNVKSSLLLCHDGTSIQFFEVKNELPKLLKFEHPYKDPLIDFEPSSVVDLTDFISPFDPAIAPSQCARKVTIIRMTGGRPVACLVWLNYGTPVAFVIGDSSELMFLVGANVDSVLNQALQKASMLNLAIDSRDYDRQMSIGVGWYGFFDAL